MKRTVKIKIFLLLVLFTVLFLVACNKAGEPDNSNMGNTDSVTGNYLVVLDLSEMTTEKVPYTLKSDNVEDSITELIEALISYQDDEFSSPIYEGVKIIDCIYSDGVTSVFFESSYYELLIADEVMMRSAIVETLCQLEEIEEVSFFIDDAPLTIQGVVVGRMNSNSFLHEMSKFNEMTMVSLYFPNKEMNGLRKTVRETTVDPRYTDEQLIIEEFLKGPQNGEPGIPVIPEGTKLLNVVTKDNVCYVNFSAEFIDNTNEVPDNMFIYSLVNTLCDISNVRGVVILIEGENLEYYKTINCSEMLTFNYDLVIEDN